MGLKPNVLVKEKHLLNYQNALGLYKRQIKRLLGTVGLDVLALQDCHEFLGYDRLAWLTFSGRKPKVRGLVSERLWQVFRSFRRKAEALP